MTNPRHHDEHSALSASGQTVRSASSHDFSGGKGNFSHQLRPSCWERSPENPCGIEPRKVKIAINGFGRIGRVLFRILQRFPNLEVVAINDVAPPEKLIYLCKRDTIYGAFPDAIDWTKIRMTQIKELTALDWSGIDIVIEATGKYTNSEEASLHLKAGAGHVIISAPAKGDIKTICMGVNHQILSLDDRLISNASCTTNCLAPVAMVLEKSFGIKKGLMTTVHAATASQPLHDAVSVKGSLSDCRAAFANIIPSTTGAAKAVGLVIPSLAGKLTGMALRVPVMTGSVVDLTVELNQSVTEESLKEAFCGFASKELSGILGCSEEPLVSSDIIGSSFSAVVDFSATLFLDDHFLKVFAWYDNEWGYASRMADLCEYIRSLLTMERASAVHQGTHR